MENFLYNEDSYSRSNAEFKYSTSHEEDMFCTMPITKKGEIDVEKAIERDKNILGLELVTKVPIEYEQDEFTGKMFGKNYNFFYIICLRTVNHGCNYGAVIIDEDGNIVNVVPPIYSNIFLSDNGYIYAEKGYSYVDIYSKNGTPQLLNVDLINEHSWITISGGGRFDNSYYSIVEFIMGTRFTRKYDAKLAHQTFVIDGQTGELNYTEYDAKDNVNVLLYPEELCRVLRR